MTDERQSLDDFIAEHGITMTAKRLEEKDTYDRGVTMHAWRCTLNRSVMHNRYRMTVTFRMGEGHNEQPPKVADVLDCIASDTSSVENARDFGDWASEYGYDENSRTAERIYRQCRKQAERLRRFLGGHGADMHSPLFEQLLWNTERL